MPSPVRLSPPDRAAVNLLGDRSERNVQLRHHIRVLTIKPAFGTLADSEKRWAFRRKRWAFRR